MFQAERKGLAAFWVMCFSILIANLCLAQCDCNDAEMPIWYMEGTQCQIYPHFYEVEINASMNGYTQQANPQSWSRSGYCTEYYTYSYSSGWYDYICPGKTNSHSDPNNENDLYCSLGSNGACFSIGAWEACYYFDATVNGSWDEKTFTGEYNSYWDDPQSDDWSNYESSTTITAEFNRGNVPAECLEEPKVTYSDYEKTMFVKPKEPTCCPSSGTQEIGISCDGASHIKATVNISGCADLVIMDDDKWTKGCDSTGAHASNGWIMVVPNHNKVIVKDGPPKTATVKYQVDFYDSAGNYLTQGSVSVNLTTECPPEPK